MILFVSHKRILLAAWESAGSLVPHHRKTKGWFWCHAVVVAPALYGEMSGYVRAASGAGSMSPCGCLLCTTKALELKQYENCLLE